MRVVFMLAVLTTLTARVSPEETLASPWERVKAFEARLASEEDEALAHAGRLLRHDDVPWVRRRVVELIADTRHESVAKHLLERALEDSSATVRATAMRLLAARSPAATLVGHLGRWSRSGSDRRRLRAVEALEHVDDSSVIKHLLRQALRGDDERVRRAANRALVRWAVSPEVSRAVVSTIRRGPPAFAVRAAETARLLQLESVSSALLRTARRENRDVQLATLRALARCARPRDVPELLRLLEKLREPSARSIAIVALSRTGVRNTAAESIYRNALMGRDPVLGLAGSWAASRLPMVEVRSLRDESSISSASTGSETLERRLALSYGWRDDDHGVSELLAYGAGDRDPLRKLALRRLGRFPTDDVRSLLEALLAEGIEPSCRAQAAYALRSLASPITPEVKDAALASSDVDTRLSILWALGRTERVRSGEELSSRMKRWSDPRLQAVSIGRVVESVSRSLALETPKPKLTDALLPWLDHRSPLVRTECVIGLGLARERRVVPHLVEALSRERHPLVRRLIPEALRAITRQDLGPDTTAWQSWWEHEGHVEEDGSRGTESRTRVGRRDHLTLRLLALRQRAVDVVFLVDVSGSMRRFLSRVHDEVMTIARHLSEIVPSFRLGFVAYRDEVVACQRLTHDMMQVSRQLRALHAADGGDAEEAIADALESAFWEVGWRDESRKVVVLIGDAPPRRPTRCEALAFFLSEGLGVTTHAVSVHRSASALPSFRRIARAGWGTFSSLVEEDGVLYETLLLALGKEWEDVVTELLRARRNHAPVTEARPERPIFRPQQVVPAQPPIKNPTVVQATDAKRHVKPEELVLGVTIDGQSRAYPLNTLTGPTREIINDELGGRAIAVTW